MGKQQMGGAPGAPARVALAVGGDAAGERLDRFLARAAPAGAALSRRAARRLIEAGAVYLDGRRVRVASRPVRRGQRVEVLLDPDAGEAAPPAVDAGWILYQDEHLVAVDKPSGVPAQATATDAVGNVLHGVRCYLRREGGSDPYLALPHRLDRGTSGVLLLGRSRAASAALAAAFAGGRVRKRYLALCAVEPGAAVAERWTVESHLATRRLGDRLRSVAVASGGKRAVTDFRLVERWRDVVLVAAEPRTGRTHQLRVHLADHRLPVVGDRLYGDAAAVGAARLMLHAVGLELSHPVTGERLALESPLPADFRREVERRSRPEGGV